MSFVLRRHAATLALALLVQVTVGTLRPAAAASLYFTDLSGPKTWDNATTLDWSLLTGGPYSSLWTSGSDAVFEGTAGTVNVSGTISSVNSITFNTDGYTLGSTGTITLTGTGGNITTGSGTDTISAILAGSVGVTKLGSGSLTLSGASTFTGGLTIAAGAVSVSAWELNTATAGAFGNMASRSSGQINVGSATTSGTIIYTGGTAVPNGTGTGINIGAAGATIQLTNGLLEIGSNAGSGTGGITGTGPLTITTNAGNRFITVAGTAAGTTTGSNSFSGPVTISANSEFQANAVTGQTETPFGAGSNGLGSTITMNSGSILDIYLPSSTTILVGSLNGPAGTVRIETTGTLTLSLGGDSTNATFGGTIINNGTLSITKTGTGNQILTGANTYTGATTISNGGYYVDGSLSTSSAIAVASGAILGGKGTAGAATVASGGILTAGDSGAGSLTLTGATFSGTGTVNVANVAAGASADILTVSGSGALKANGAASSVAINVGGAAPASTGVYKLIGYSGAIGGTGAAGAFTLGTLPNRVTGALVNNTNELDLNVTSTDYPVWTGASTGNWNTTDVNWKLGNAGTSTAYLQNDSVLFNDTASTNTVDINAANVTPILTTVNTASSYTIQSLEGYGIAGAGALSATGTGTLTLSSNNSFSGGVTISGGATLRAATIANGGSSSSLGAGTSITFGSGGGTLNYTGNTASTNRSIVLTGAGAIEATTSGQTLTLAGVISGTGNLTIPSASLGGITLAGANTNTGTIFVGGAVNVSTWNSSATAGAWGSQTNSTATSTMVNMVGGTINYTGAAGTLSLLRGVDVASGLDTINVQNSGAVLVFSTASNTGFQFNGGTLDKTGAGVLQIAANAVANNVFNVASRVIIDGGTLDWFGGGSMPTNAGLGGVIANMITIDNGGAFELSYTGGSTVPTDVGFNLNGSASINIPASTHTIQGVIANGASGSGTLVNIGAGTLALTGTNTYTGGAAFNAGVLQAGSAGALGTTGTLTFAGGTLQYTSASASQDYSSRFSTAAGQAVKVDVNGQSVAWATGLTSSGGGLTLTGTAGTLTLSGASTYTGATAINVGKLVITSAGSLGPTAISVASAATFAPQPSAGGMSFGAGTGTGTAGATLNLMSGSIFDMTDGAIGTVNLQQQAGFVATALTISTATLKFDLLSGGTDTLAVSKGATVSGVNNITLATATTGLTPGTYNLITAPSGGLTGTFQFTGGGTSASIVSGGFGYTLGLSDSTGAVQLVVTQNSLNWTGQTGGNGAANSSWDLSSTNWANNSNQPVTYNINSVPVFADTNPVTAQPVSNSDIVVQAGGINPPAVAFSGNSVAYTLDATGGAIGGSTTTLQKTGSALLIVNNVNTYGGGSTISNGTVRLGSNSTATGGAIVSGPLGTGAITLTSGGVLQDNGTPITLLNALVLNGSATFASSTAGTLTVNSTGLTTPNTVTLQNNPTLTVNNTAVINDVITGTGQTLSIAGMGALTLGSANTFNGGIAINGGTVTVGSVAANTSAQPLGEGNWTLGGGVLVYSTTSGGITTSANQNLTLTASTTSTLTITDTTSNGGDGGFQTSGKVTGSGNLIVNAAAGVNTNTRVIFNGANDFTGNITLNNGIFQNNFNAANAFTFGNNAAWTVNGGELRLYNITTSNTPTVSLGSLAGAGGFVDGQNGANPITFQIGGNNQSTTYSGVIRNNSAPTAVTKVGSGTLRLSGVNTYTGVTTVSNGTLAIGSTGSLGNTAISVAAAATFAPQPATGAINLGGSLTLNSGAIYDMTDGAAGTVNLAQGLTISGATLNFDLTPTNADRLVVGGTASASGTNSIGITYGNSGLTYGTYPLIVAGSGLAGVFQFTGGGTSMSVTSNSTNYMLTLANSSLGEVLEVTNGRALTWTGTNSDGVTANSSWDATAGSTNWADASNAAASYTDGSVVAFGDTNPISSATIASGNVNIQVSGVAPALVSFNGNSVVYTLTSAGSVGITGPAAVAKTGAATLVINNTNTYTGGTSISGGIVQVGSSTTTSSGAISGGPLGTGVIAISGGATLQSNGGGIVLANNFVIAGAAVLDGGNSGTLSLDSTGVTAPATVALSGGPTLTINNSLAINDAITGSGQGLTVNGAGSLTLGGVNTFSGALTIGGGNGITVNVPTWNVPSSNGVWGNNSGLIQLTGGSITYSGATINAGAIRGVNVASGTNTINIQNAGTILDFDASNTFQFNGGDLHKTGPGTLQLGDNVVANNVFTAGSHVIIDAGTLDWFGGGSMPGPIAPVANMITINNNATFQLSYTGGSIVSVNDGFNLNGAANFRILSGASSSHTIAGPIADGSGGPGTLVKQGSGTLVVSGVDTYSGGTVFNAGVLQDGSGTGFGSTGTLSFGGGTLQYSAASFGNDYSARISTAAGQPVAVDTNGQNVVWASPLVSSGGTLTKLGAGILTLQGASTYSGTTTIAGGEVNAGVADTAGISGPFGSGGAITFTGGAIQYSSANQADYSNRIANSTAAIAIDTNTQNVAFNAALPVSNIGGLTKSGAGTLTLNAANNYLGPTTVNAGSLVMGSGGALYATASTAGALAVNSGGTLDLQGTTQNVGNLNGGGSILNNANGTTATLVVGNGNATGGNYQGVIADNNISGTGKVGLTKVGTGIQSLAGANTYSGPTVISGGTLRLTTSLPFANAGFETPALAAGGWSYNTPGGSWTFTGFSGIGNNGSPWVTTAPEGVQVGFVQNSGSFSQSISVPASGNYDFSFQATNRPGYGADNLTVQVDGVTVATLPAATINNGAVFKTYAATGIPVTAGMHTLVFVGSAATGDNATAIDNIITSGHAGGALPSATAVTITSGALDLNGNSQTVASLTGATGTNVYLGGATLTVGDSNNTAFAGVITDSGGASSGTGGSLTKVGSGMLTLSGANSYSGSTNVNVGALVLSGAGTLGASTAGLNLGGGALDFGGSSQTVGAVNITAAAASGNTIQNGTINATSYAVSNVSGNAIVTASLAGAGGLSMTGAGTLTLANNNSYGGNTTVSNGTLRVTNTTGSATGSGTVTLSGSTLASGTTGIITGAVLAGGGTHTIAPGGVGTIGALTVGGLTLNGNTNLNFDITSPSSLDVLTDTGALAIASGPVNIVAPTGLGNGTYKLIGYNSTTLSDASGFEINSGSTPTGYSLTLNTGSNELDLIVGSSNSLWTSTAAVNWSSPGNWSGAVPHRAGDTAVFDNMLGGAASGSVTLDGSQTVGHIQFNNALASYNIAAGTGTLTIDNTGGSGSPSIDVNAGSHTIAAPLALAAGVTVTAAADPGPSFPALTISGTITGSGGITKAGMGTLLLANTNSYGGTTTVNTGALRTTADGALGNSSLVVNAAVSLGGNEPNVTGLSGASTGSLSIAASKTLTITQTGSSTFAGGLTNNGGLTIASGSVEIDGAPTLNSGSTLTVNAGTLKFNISSNPTVQSSVTATVASGATLELAGAISALADPSALSASGSDANPTERAQIYNAGTLAIDPPMTGTAAQQVGGIDPNGATAGSVVLNDGANLIADHINQTSLVIGNGSTFTLAPSDINGNPMAAGLVLAGSLAPSSSFIASSGSLLGASGSEESLPPSVALGGVMSRSVSAVPEPTTIALLLLGSLGVWPLLRPKRIRS